MNQNNVRWLARLSTTLIGYSAFLICFYILTIIATLNAFAIPVAQFSARHGIPAGAYITLVLLLAISGAAFTARQAYGWIAARGARASLWIVSAAILISGLLTVQAVI